jgi:membrane-bound lytic murein transglycosylase D
MQEERYREVRMPAYVSVGPLERALNIDSERLQELNPALRPAVWRGRLAVPRGYELRLPAGGPTLTAAMLVRRLGPQEMLASAAASHRARQVAARAQLVTAVMNPVHTGSAPPVVASAAPAYYSRVAMATSSAQSTSTPASVPVGNSLPPSAAKFGLGNQHLLDFNGIDGDAPGAGTATDSMLMSSQRSAMTGPAQSDESGSADEGEQPVSAAEADAESPSLGPTDVSAQSQNPDPTDYAVASNDTIQIAAAETLGHYAEWLGVRASDLRRINHMRFRTPVIVGHRIRLDFRRVPPGEFEARRREYHQVLEANYFASHRIDGTEQYVAQRGDSLWTLTQRFAQLPLWLLRQYNPDTDFTDLRPGTQLVVPRIENVSAADD